MLGYLVRRLLSGFLAFYLFLTALFFGVNWLIPGDFVDTLVLFIGPSERETLREELGLNASLGQQYVNWIKGLSQGDLGRVYTLGGEGPPVTEMLAEALPATLLVFVTGALIAFALGYWLGRVSGWRLPGWLSGPLTFTSIATYTAFPPWLAFLLVYVFIDAWPRDFAARLARPDFTRRLWVLGPFTQETVMLRMVYSLVAMLVVLWVLNRASQRLAQRSLPVFLSLPLLGAGLYLAWSLGGYLEYAVEVLQVALVPLLAFTLLSFGDTMLIMRSNMLDTRHEVFVKTALAKGLSSTVVRDRHVARNALLPALSRFVINIPYLLTAIVIIEQATGWHGIGSMLFNGLYNQNTLLFMNVMVVIGLVTLVGRLGLDVATVLLDPRLRHRPEAVSG